jgi:hypothetical protein
MSTSAIIPTLSADFGVSSSTAAQQSVFQVLISQLEQSIDGGDLTTSQTLLNAIDALSPSSASADSALGTFLTSVSKALEDGSVGEAQSALSAYQNATPPQSGSVAPAADSGDSPGAIASGLVLSQVQLNLVSSLLGNGPSNQPDSSSSTLDSLLNILNAAYSSGNGSADGASSPANSTSPYDALVSAIQSSVASGSGTANPALAYLGSTGNFVDTAV